MPSSHSCGVKSTSRANSCKCRTKDSMICFRRGFGSAGHLLDDGVSNRVVVDGSHSIFFDLQDVFKTDKVFSLFSP